MYYNDFYGIYVSELNYEGYIENLTENKLMDKFEDCSIEFSCKNYGVCDNASQVIDYIDNLLKDGIIREKDKYIAVLTPMFKDSNSGFRWHKLGSYIGVQNREYEYLSDEKHRNGVCF